MNIVGLRTRWRWVDDVDRDMNIVGPWMDDVDRDMNIVGLRTRWMDDVDMWKMNIVD